LNALVQIRIITSSSAEISLEFDLHYIYIVFNVNYYLLMYSDDNCT